MKNVILYIQYKRQKIKYTYKFLWEKLILGIKKARRKKGGQTPGLKRCLKALILDA
jgi:hypothetical protein